MIRRMMLALLALAVVTSWGCSDGREVEGDLVPRTPEELDLAVRSAIQALLDAPAFEATTVWYGEAGGPVRSGGSSRSLL